MGRNIAFCIETFQNHQWMIHHEWLESLSTHNGFHRLELLHYTPTYPIYSMAPSSEFIAILCGIGNDDEQWCNPISQQWGLPNNVSPQVLEEFNHTSDSVYGEPICILLSQFIEYDFNQGWLNEQKVKDPFSPDVLNKYHTLMNELKELGTPQTSRIVFWFF